MSRSVMEWDSFYFRNIVFNSNKRKSCCSFRSWNKERLSLLFTASFAPDSQRFYSLKSTNAAPRSWESLKNVFKLCFKHFLSLNSLFFLFTSSRIISNTRSYAAAQGFSAPVEANKEASLNYESFYRSRRNYSPQLLISEKCFQPQLWKLLEQRALWSLDSRCTGFSSGRQRNLKYFPTFARNSKAARQIIRHWGEMTRRRSLPWMDQASQ